MAHPSASFPNGFHIVDGTTAVTPSHGSYFTSVLCVEAGDVSLVGSNVYTNNTAVSDSSATVITMSAGMIIYGRFTSVAQSSGGKYIAYLA